MRQDHPVNPPRIWRDTAVVLGTSASTGNTMT